MMDLDPALVRRLWRPVERPGVINPGLAQALFTRHQRMVAGLPLVELMSRHTGAVSDLAGASVPIVYALPSQSPPAPTVPAVPSSPSSDARPRPPASGPIVSAVPAQSEVHRAPTPAASDSSAPRSAPRHALAASDALAIPATAPPLVVQPKIAGPIPAAPPMVAPADSATRIPPRPPPPDPGPPGLELRRAGTPVGPQVVSTPAAPAAPGGAPRSVPAPGSAPVVAPVPVGGPVPLVASAPVVGPVPLIGPSAMVAPAGVVDPAPAVGSGPVASTGASAGRVAGSGRPSIAAARPAPWPGWEQPVGTPTHPVSGHLEFAVPAPGWTGRAAVIPAHRPHSRSDAPLLLVDLAVATAQPDRDRRAAAEPREPVAGRVAGVSRAPGMAPWSAPGQEADGPRSADRAAPPGRPPAAPIDVEQLVDTVHRRFVRRLAIEAERRAVR